MVERPGPLSLSRQCELLGLSRAAVYYQRVEVGAYELELMALIDRQYLRTPFYGSRRMTAWLQTQGHTVNRKRVQRLMQRMGLAAIYQRPRTYLSHHPMIKTITAPPPLAAGKEDSETVKLE